MLQSTIKIRFQQQKEVGKMSIEGRIRELTSKHRELDQEIQDAQKHSAIDTLTITELKRRKLRVKEELSSLRP